MNQHVYLELLRDKLGPWVNTTFGESGITLHQDGATPHTANLVQEWCKRNIVGFWPKELWPPSSPELNPMDFVIWSNLESKACSSNHRSIESLMLLKSCWDEISQETIGASCNQVADRLRHVVKAKDDYFEK